MIDAEKILRDTYPKLKLKKNKLLLKIVKKLLYEDEINEIISKNKHLRGFAFLDKLLAHFNFTYQVNSASLANIPTEGRLLIVANHPIGTLDGLALVKLIRSVRPDVRIVANQVLMNMQPLQSVFLPVDILSGKASYKAAYEMMLDALHNEEAVIVFPAGEVSRLGASGVRDSHWKSGFIKLAKKTNCPVLPIYIKALNSLLFYGASLLYKPLSQFLLVNEMFNKHNQELTFIVGKLITYNALRDAESSPDKLAQRMHKHVLNLAKKSQPALFKTVTTLAHPTNTKALKKALYQARLLGETKDGKKIFLYRYANDCPVMQEIGRLRELTFRTVEEGTGHCADVDEYDVYYQHLVLWDEQDLEIVGAYRLGVGKEILENQGISGFYTQSLFEFSPDFHRYLPESIELGRSFVQPRYWGQRSLDYLWYGIGAYLREQPQVKYMFGAVSLSNAYPQGAKEKIVGFYRQQFGSERKLAAAKQPFILSDQGQVFAETEFNRDYQTSFTVLTSELKKLGVKVPVLYKQYVELCQENGCHFIDFNIDSGFNDCIDSLILVEFDKIKTKKRQRYIENTAI